MFKGKITKNEFQINRNNNFSCEFIIRNEQVRCKMKILQDT